VKEDEKKCVKSKGEDKWKNVAEEYKSKEKRGKGGRGKRKYSGRGEEYTEEKAMELINSYDLHRTKHNSGTRMDFSIWSILTPCHRYRPCTKR
jgi:hypothetical protein